MERKIGPIKVISSTNELRNSFKYWAGKICETLNVDLRIKEKAYKK